MSREVVAEEVVRVVSALHMRGFISSVGGNVSARLDERRVLITPSGALKFTLAPEDLVEVDLEGRVVRGGTPSSELPVHLAIYRAREDVGAIVHAHPPYTVSASVVLPTPFLEGLRLTPESVVHVGRVRVLGFATPGEGSAKLVGDASREADLVVVRNHGVFSLGRGPWEAYVRLEVFEENARLLFTALLLRAALAGLGGVRDLEELGLGRAEREALERVYGRR